MNFFKKALAPTSTDANAQDVLPENVGMFKGGAKPRKNVRPTADHRKSRRKRMRQRADNPFVLSFMSM